MSDNIVLFPKQKKDSPPNSMSQVYENALNSRKEHVEYVIDEILSNVFGFCREEGFDLASEKCLKTTAMLIEAVRAGLYRSVDIFHALHPVADDMFDTDSGEFVSEELPEPKTPPSDNNTNNVTSV